MENTWENLIFKSSLFLGYLHSSWLLLVVHRTTIHFSIIFILHRVISCNVLFQVIFFIFLSFIPKRKFIFLE